MADISDNNVEIITDNNVKITRANNVQLTTDNNVKITTDSNVEMTTDNVKITTDKNMEITTDNNMEVATDNVEITADDTEDIFIFWVNQQSSQIGGEGKIVEIEWCSGGHLVEGPWIFGGIEKSTGQFFVVPTEDSSSATFLHIFQEKVRPGSTVVSDIWKPSEYLDDEDVHNLTVNYSMNFEDLQIDFPCWANVRRLIPRKGRRKKYYLGYLSEALFMVHYPIHTQRFHSFWVSVGRMYPPITQA
ncbi:hypothetical protein YQE_07498, partial [Dendroctonus ponderosae]